MSQWIDEQAQARSRRRKWALTLALLALVGAVASIGSWAAWQVTDTNGSNNFSTSTVLLQDNQGGQAGSATSSGTALFNVTNLSPGSSSTTACIGVKYTGTNAPSALTLSASLSGSGQTALQGQLTVVDAKWRAGTVPITAGSNTNSGACTSYPSTGTETSLGTQGSTLASWTGGGPYTVTGAPTDAWYKFTVSGLPAGATDCTTYCNKTITLALNWNATAA